MEWRTLERYPTYEVSDEGALRNRRTKRLIKPFPNSNGVMRYILFDVAAGPRQRHVIWQRDVVAMAFIPNPKGCKRTRSLDGDITNCHPSNIEWIEGD